MATKKYTDKELAAARELAVATKGMDMAAFDEWISYRKTRKPAVIPASYPKLISRFLKLGEHQQVAVDHSIAMGWQGLYLPSELREGVLGIKPGELW